MIPLGCPSTPPRESGTKEPSEVFEEVPLAKEPALSRRAPGVALASPFVPALDFGAAIEDSEEELDGLRSSCWASGEAQGRLRPLRRFGVE